MMTDPPRDYRPIPCARYSEYELAILRRHRLRLRWCEGRVIHEEIVTPRDLCTRDHQEFLICRAQDGTELTLRLDCIRHMEPR